MQHNTKIPDNIVRNLKRHCMRLTGGDAHSADDLYQDVMVRFYRYHYEEKGYLNSYLHIIATNAFISVKRKQKTRQKLDGLAFREPGSCGNDGSLEMEASYIMEAVSKVAEMYRVPLLMYANGKKYEEIAEEMGLPLGTVKARIFFARKKAEKLITLINGRVK